MIDLSSDTDDGTLTPTNPIQYATCHGATSSMHNGITQKTLRRQSRDSRATGNDLAPAPKAEPEPGSPAEPSRSPDERPAKRQRHARALAGEA